MDFRELINEEDVKLPEDKPLEMLVMGLNKLFKDGELPNKLRGEQFLKKAENSLKTRESANERRLKRAAEQYFKKNYRTDKGAEQEDLFNFIDDLNDYAISNVNTKSYKKLMGKINKNGRRYFKFFWDTLFKKFVNEWPIANLTSYNVDERIATHDDDFDEWKKYQTATIYNRLYFIFVVYKFLLSVGETKALPNKEQAVKYAQIRKGDKTQGLPTDSGKSEFGTATNVQNILKQAMGEIFNLNIGVAAESVDYFNSLNESEIAELVLHLEEEDLNEYFSLLNENELDDFILLIEDKEKRIAALGTTKKSGVGATDKKAAEVQAANKAKAEAERQARRLAKSKKRVDPKAAAQAKQMRGREHQQRTDVNIEKKNKAKFQQGVAKSGLANVDKGLTQKTTDVAKATGKKVSALTKGLVNKLGKSVPRDFLNVFNQRKQSLESYPPQILNFANTLSYVYNRKAFTPEKFNTLLKSDQLNVVDQASTWLDKNPNAVKDAPYLAKAINYMVWSKMNGPGGDPKWAQRFAARHPKLAAAGKMAKGVGKAGKWLLKNLF